MNSRGGRNYHEDLISRFNVTMLERVDLTVKLLAYLLARDLPVSITNEQTLDKPPL